MIHASLDFDACGVSAAQTMAGEDADKAARVSQQHAQVGVGVIARPANAASVLYRRMHVSYVVEDR